jgi:hypothetical protein
VNLHRSTVDVFWAPDMQLEEIGGANVLNRYELVHLNVGRHHDVGRGCDRWVASRAEDETRPAGSEPSYSKLRARVGAMPKRVTRFAVSPHVTGLYLQICSLIRYRQCCGHIPSFCRSRWERIKEGIDLK